MLVLDGGSLAVRRQLLALLVDHKEGVDGFQLYSLDPVIDFKGVQVIVKHLYDDEFDGVRSTYRVRRCLLTVVYRV